MKIQAFCDVAPISTGILLRIFLEEYSVLKTEALRCSETPVTTSRCNMPEDMNREL
jgi:hypothetical protein